MRVFGFSIIKLIVGCLFLGSVLGAEAQSVSQILKPTFEQIERDTCLQKASISFCLLDKKSGKVLFEKNKDLLLAPASTLKTFTTAVALQVLGENYQYKTKIIFKGEIQHHIGYGTLYISGSGDPSFGSDRFDDTKPEIIFKKIAEAFKSKGIQKWIGNIIVEKKIFIDEAINKGWLDEDIGNYYGAGIYNLNWRENKFELNLAPTKTSFEITSNTAGYDNKKDFCIELTHKDGATTEEAFAFIEKDRPCRYVIRGVLTNQIPTQNMQLARLSPEEDFIRELSVYLEKEGIFEYKNQSFPKRDVIELTTIMSPPLSKLVFWCNQKSLNLYAESFCKTIAAHLFKRGSWQMGVSAMKRYAKSFHLSTDSISLLDGSGLAPENKITTFLLASLLQKASNQNFFPTFYESLPSINGLKMKSGYIGGTRSYSGYIRLKDSTEACFAFIMHNYTCSPKEVKLKMFQVLDKLK